MGELNESSRDEAIQGRVTAFKFGLNTLKNNIYGVGIHQFMSGMKRTQRFSIAAHSSYVQVGGELGWPGLFIFVGILYCCLRTLISAKTTDVTEERVRRILFVLLVSYAVSSWMVNWPWRTTFFLMVGAIAAFHRLMVAKHPANPVETEPQTELTPASALIGLQHAPALSATVPSTFNQAALTPTLEKKKALFAQEFPDSAPAGLRWNKLGWVDLVLMIVLTWVTIRFWQYLINII